MDLSTYLRAERGRTQRLAVALQVSGSLVAQWNNGKPIAPRRCPAIEVATGGAVRRWDLRPNDWWEIWPELIGLAEAPSRQRTATEAVIE